MDEDPVSGVMASRGSILRLAAFIVGIVLVGFAIGMVSNPKDAYAGFIKPSFAPPAWVFGPVWTALYVMIGIAGWRIHERAPASTEMRLWWAQMVLNFIWTPIFFLASSRALALTVILALLAVIGWLIARLWRRDRSAALLLVPYAAWVGFATLLNAAIVRLN
jgi:tryptophan-rich sensory protein